MKVRIMTGELSGKGGTEAVIRQFMREIVKYDKDIEIALTIFGKVEDKNWLEDIGEFKLFQDSIFFSTPKIGKKLYSYKELLFCKDDVIVSSNPYLIKRLSILRKILRRKYKIVSWLHISFSDKYLNSAKHEVMLADYHFSISTAMAEEIKQTQGFNDNIYKIFNPVKKIKKTISKPVIPTFISVGRLSSEKNQIELLRAAIQLPKNKAWKIQFWGDGSERENLEKFVADNDIEDRVEFKGWVYEPWEQIENGTALVLTSSLEGFGMVLTEAISRGLPCISSDCEGPLDIINPDNGYLYKRGDVDELTTLLNDFIVNDMKYENIKKSINHLYEEFYFEKVISSLKEIIKR